MKLNRLALAGLASLATATKTAPKSLDTSDPGMYYSHVVCYTTNNLRLYQKCGRDPGFRYHVLLQGQHFLKPQGLR